MLMTAPVIFAAGSQFIYALKFETSGLLAHAGSLDRLKGAVLSALTVDAPMSYRQRKSLTWRFQQRR